ncbi:alpha-1A adrenergic receptor-like [Amblyomma americanum]|uniref:G-protein coupled receptors family 1 profile domain-containing protein n=1 Tax=Amblyomma americanum TaxID=6943 RepID=A0AAQ4EAJ8_AMBAM
MEGNGSEPWLLSFVENASSWTANATEPAGLAPGALLKGGLLLAIILLAISGNLMVLLAVFLNASLRTATNCLIVNLALADLLLGASVLPFSAALEVLDKQWFFGQIFCHVWAATDVLCCTASINSLCVISVDRYIGVTRPLTYSSVVTHRRALVACVLVWLLSAVISVGPLLGWREPPPADPFVCEVTKQTGYVIFSVSFSFYIPTLVILVLYFRIYKAAARQTKFLRTGVKTIKGEPGQLTLRVHTPSVAGDEAQRVAGLQGRLVKFKRQKKAAKTLGIVVGVFIICWFPFFFLLPLGTLCQRCTVPPLLFDFCFWTGYFNSCLNPFIYASTSREYKRAFHAILRCQWSRPREGASFLPPDQAWPGNFKVAAVPRADRAGSVAQPPLRAALRSGSCGHEGSAHAVR